VGEVNQALDALDPDAIEDEEQQDFVEELEAIGTTTIERRRDMLEELDRIDSELEPGKTGKIKGFLKRERLRKERRRMEGKLTRNASVLTALSDTVVRSQGLPQKQEEHLVDAGVEPKEATSIAFTGRRTPETQADTAGAIEKARRQAAEDVTMGHAVKVFGTPEAALKFEKDYQEATMEELKARAESLRASALNRGQDEMSPDDEAMLRAIGTAKAETYLYYTDQGDRANIGDAGLRAISYNGKEDRDDFRSNNKAAWDRAVATLGRTDLVSLAKSVGVDDVTNIDEDQAFDLFEKVQTGVFEGADVIRQRYNTELLAERGITTKRDMLWQVAYGLQNFSIGIDEVQEALSLYANSDYNSDTGGGFMLIDPEAIEWAFGADGTNITNFTKEDLAGQGLSERWKEDMLVEDAQTGEAFVLSLYGAYLRTHPPQRVYGREDLNRMKTMRQHKRLMEILKLITTLPIDQSGGRFGTSE
jgi:hypothetical protein